MSTKLTWVTSDHHFGHERIIELERSQFEDTDQMNQHMVDRWNSVVAPEDIVYHLGDFSLGLTEEEMIELIASINGTITLVRGNHDRWGKKRLLGFGFKDVVNRLEIGPYVLTHRPVNKEMLGNKFNIHGHTHSNIIGHDNYINVCVEQTNYTPVRLDSII